MEDKDQKENYLTNLTPLDIYEVETSKEHYGDLALNHIIENSITTDADNIFFSPLVPNRNLEETINIFRESGKERCIIPLHVSVFGSGHANHFTGLYIQNIDVLGSPNRALWGPGPAHPGPEVAICFLDRFVIFRPICFLDRSKNDCFISGPTW